MINFLLSSIYKISIIKAKDSKMLKVDQSVSLEKDCFVKNEIFNQDEINEIINSVESGKSKKIGEGISSTCYKVDLKNPKLNISSVVVKKQIPEEIGNKNLANKIFAAGYDTLSSERFVNEFNVLKKIYPLVKNVPKPLAFFKKDNIYYMIMSFVEGKQPDPENNPLTKKHLKTLLDTFFTLDKNNILHYDLKRSNLLITEKQANIIDFGTPNVVANEYIFNTKTFNPYFPLQSNIEDFETCCLYPYFQKMLKNEVPSKEIRSFFSEYLKIKSEYHLNRANLLENLERTNQNEINKLGKAIKYEKRQAKLLKNPSDNIVDIEALKIQTKYLSNIIDSLIREIFQEAMTKATQNEIGDQEKNKISGSLNNIIKGIFATFANFLKLNNTINYLIKNTNSSENEKKYYKDTKIATKQLFDQLLKNIVSNENNFINGFIKSIFKKRPEFNFNKFLDKSFYDESLYKDTILPLIDIAQTIIDSKFTNEEDQKKFQEELIKEEFTEESAKEKRDSIQHINDTLLK